MRPCSSVGRVTEDLIRRSWVRFPPRSKDFFFASCGSLFPFTRANAQWVIHGFKWHYNLHFRVNSLFHYLCSQCYAAQHSYVPFVKTDLLIIWKHRVGLDSARATLCKWATRTRQTCFSKTFANSQTSRNNKKLSKAGFGYDKALFGKLTN